VSVSVWSSIIFLTLTEVFPCFFLSCKANARVKLAKTGHGSHSSTLFVICVVRLLFVLFYFMYYLCVNVYCHRVTTQLQLINISYRIISSALHNRLSLTLYRVFYEFWMLLCKIISYVSVIKEILINIVLFIINALLPIAPATHVVAICGTRPVTAGGWYTNSMLICHAHERSPHPNGTVHCGRSWDFWKPALNTDQCNLQAVSVMKLNLYVKFIR